MSRRMLGCSCAFVSMVAATPLAGAPANDAQRLVVFTEQQIPLPDGLPQALAVNVQLNGPPHTPQLHAHSLRAPSFQLRVQGAGGVIQTVAAPPPSTYRGEVLGPEGGVVAASIVSGRLVAALRAADGTVWGIQPMSAVAANAPPGA